MKYSFREAKQEDLPFLVNMLADDLLGKRREDTTTPLNPAYVKAFGFIDSSPDNELIVAETDAKIAGMMQLTFIPYLTHTGTWRCLIEGVRIHADFRGRGLGTKMIQWAIGRAEQRGCALVQLTTDKQRPDAIRFYEDLGFEATHEGLKLKLS